VELDLCRENEPAVDTSVGAGESFVQPPGLMIQRQKYVAANAHVPEHCTACTVHPKSPCFEFTLPTREKTYTKNTGPARRPGPPG
jgi:hypothetical protein